MNLAAAINTCDVNMVKSMLQFGIDPNVLQGCYTMLEYTLYNKHSVGGQSQQSSAYDIILMELLKYGAKPDYYGRSALRVAIQMGDMYAAEQLLNYNANPNVMDECKFDFRQNFIHLLVKSGADVQKVFDYAHSPFYIALLRNVDGLIDLAIERKLDFNVCDCKEFYTEPFIISFIKRMSKQHGNVFDSYLRSFRRILSTGIDVDIIDIDGISVRNHIKQNERIEIVYKEWCREACHVLKYGLRDRYKLFDVNIFTIIQNYM
jgi:hypothetical protein